MRLGITDAGSGPHIVVEHEDVWYNLSAALQARDVIRDGAVCAPVTTLEALIALDRMQTAFIADALDTLRRHDLLEAYALPAAPTRFALPVRPGKIIALGRNYAAHAAETGHEPPKEPVFFAKPVSACIADGEPIVVKPWYGQVDHEAELALVIGKRMKDVPVERALECVAGYTLMNDVTARDMQAIDMAAAHPWFRSKGIDTFGPLGPVVTLPESMPDPLHVDITLTVNGALRQQSNTAMFLFSIAEMLAFVTRFLTLEPGDIVSTGTPEGIAPITPGDTVEVRVPEIGVLTNPVIAG